MNALINCDKIYCSLEVEEDFSEKMTIGDTFAASIVGLFAMMALSVGCWNGILLCSGNINSGGPVKYVVMFLQALGII